MSKYCMSRITMNRYTGVLTLLLILITLSGCASILEGRKKPPRKVRPAKEPAPLIKGCIPSLKSDCRATQKELQRAFIDSLAKYGLGNQPTEEAESPLALSVLPRDRFGHVNWTKAAMDGIIRPRSSIEGNGAEDEPFNMIVLFQVKVLIMADVLFPHTVHTYWLSCNTCHPKIFKPEIGSNRVTMTDINKGLYCGKCHGKVAFSVEPDPINCRRCHFFMKKY